MGQILKNGPKWQGGDINGFDYLSVEPVQIERNKHIQLEALSFVHILTERLFYFDQVLVSQDGRYPKKVPFLSEAKNSVIFQKGVV